MIAHRRGYVPVLSLLLGSALACAQDPAGPAKGVERPTVQPMEIIAERPADLISDQADAVRKQRSEFALQREKAEEVLRTADLKIEMKEKEVELLEAQVDAAASEKRESEVASLTALQQTAEKGLEVLQMEKALKVSEVEAAEAGEAYATAMEKALDMEKELAKRREENAELGASAGPVAGALARDLEGKVLLSRLDAARSKERMAALETEVLERLEELFDAQNNLDAGRK